MAARTQVLNFGTKFYGSDSYKKCDVVVVLVGQGEWICEKPKWVRS
jgi:hypothetical protein